MATLKDVQQKISAVKKTRQITKAMNMVATSRLRAIQTVMDRFRPYATKFSEVLSNLVESAGEESSPLIVPREEVKRLHVVLCTSDRGLCGGFNVNLIDKATEFLKSRSNEELEISFTIFGKRGVQWLKRKKYPIVDRHVGVIGAKIGFNTALNAGRKLVDAYLDGTYDQVFVVYPEFISMAKQKPVVKQLLPIPSLAKPKTEVIGPYKPEHICEPSSEELLNELLPRNVYVQLYRTLLETSTSEHAARRTAMDNATKACNDMLESLTLIYNKARQAAITADLMDIICGAEALKG